MSDCLRSPNIITISGGMSPINDQNRALIAALRLLLQQEGPNIPVYWGIRNWHPFLSDTVRQMKSDGIRRAAAFITSAFGSYSGCKQYKDDIARAVAEVEGAPEIIPLAQFWNHDGFLSAFAEHVRTACDQFSSDAARRVHCPQRTCSDGKHRSVCGTTE